MLNHANSPAEPILLRPSNITDISAQLSGTAATPSLFGKVAICIPTCKRPENLSELLKTVRELDTTGAVLHLIVVDNDSEKSAYDVVRTAMRGSSIPVTYDCVPERSLPLVRNRLVKLANDIQADWILFADDDMLVEPDSLQLMLETAMEHDADCVAPRVRHKFDSGKESWAIWSGLFDELPRATGKTPRRFGSAGKLLRVRAVNQVPGPFDLRLRLTGGEDSLFFARFHAHGLRTVGCNEALMHDRVHSSRDNPRWLTQRALRIGVSKGFIVREVEPSILRSLKWVVAGLGYAIANLLIAIALLPFGPSTYFRYWLRAVRGYGTAFGTLFPSRFLGGQEYATVHGR